MWTSFLTIANHLRGPKRDDSPAAGSCLNSLAAAHGPVFQAHGLLGGQAARHGRHADQMPGRLEFTQDPIDQRHKEHYASGGDQKQQGEQGSFILQQIFHHDHPPFAGPRGLICGLPKTV
jgi:hypothetical protein